MKPKLGGIRILDLSIVTAGAGSTQLLGDLGADVVKVESMAHPDLFRHWTALTGAVGGSGDLASAPFRVVNRNKRGIDIDLRSDRGVETFLGLAAKCDVVVENFRRGVIERLGIGYDQLVKARPNIVLVSLSSQGATGPNAEFASFGSTLDALGGLMSMTGYSQERPTWSRKQGELPRSDSVAARAGAGRRGRDVSP